MTEGDTGQLSESLQDFFIQADEIVNGKDSKTEYHDTKSASPKAIVSSPVSETDDPYIQFAKMKDDPNEGMVIVQMDDGGPRMKRRKATEIVIPLDPVSSSERICASDSEDSTNYSDVSSDTVEESSFQMDESLDAEYKSLEKTEEPNSPTSPVKTTRLNPKSSVDRFHSNGEAKEITSEAEQSERGDTDVEDMADEEENVASSDSSASESVRSDSVELSRESFINMCYKFNKDMVKLGDLLEARDRLGRYLQRPRPNPQVPNSITLRMYSALSANCKLRNIDYDDLESKPGRSNSATLESVLSRVTPAIGDTVEFHHGNTRSIPVDETPTENDSSSPVCSTRFDFTPAARSKIEGAITECSGAVNGARSVESGRKNPQAKEDSEVRCDKTNELPTIDLLHRQYRKSLPPISKAKGEEKNETKTKPTESCDKPILIHRNTIAMPRSAVKQATEACQTRKKCTNMKPGIPHQLRSIACYQDGKVEVSITGDKRLIPDSEPLNVNITFIHRHDILSTQKTKVVGEADYKKEDDAQQRRQTLPKNSGRSVEMLPTMKKPLPPLKNQPPSCNGKFGQKQTLGHMSSKCITLARKHKIPSMKILPPLRNVPEEMKNNIQNTKRKCNGIGKGKQKMKLGRKYDDINWNVVNDRAQWPPFNTYINQEASERHQKLFADIPI